MASLLHVNLAIRLSSSAERPQHARELQLEHCLKSVMLMKTAYVKAKTKTKGLTIAKL